LLLRRAGQIVWLVAFWPLLASLANAATPPLLFFNGRALPLLVSVTTTWIVFVDAQLRRNAPQSARSSEAGFPQPIDFYAVHAVIGGAWLLLQESFLAFQWHGDPGSSNWQVAAACFSAGLLSVYAVTVFYWGVRLRSTTLRTCVLIVGLATLALGLAGALCSPFGWLPGCNFRCVFFVAASLAIAAAGRVTTRHRTLFDAREMRDLGWWPVVLSLLVLTGLTIETYHGVAFWTTHGRQHYVALVEIPSLVYVWALEAFLIIGALWIVYGYALLTLGCIHRQIRLRCVAAGVAAGGLVFLMCNSLLGAGAPWLPWLNLRCVGFAAATALLFAVVARLRQQRDRLSAVEQKALPYLALGAALLPLWPLTQETYETYRACAGLVGQDWAGAALFTLTIVWHGYAFALLWHGLRTSSLPHRLAAYLGAVAASGILVFFAGVSANAAWLPLFSIRNAAFAAALLLTATAVRHLRAAQAHCATREQGATLLAEWVVAALLIAGLSCELYSLCHYFRAALGEHWAATANLGLAMLWTTYALAVLELAIRRDSRLFRYTAYVLAVLGSYTMFAIASSAISFDWAPLLNARFAGYIVVPAVLALAAVRLRSLKPVPQFEGLELPLVAAFVAAALLLIGLTEEAYATCYYSRDVLGMHWQRWGEMSMSVVWSIYGALLLIAGIHRNYQPLRLVALGLLGFTAFKVFLFDLSFLDGSLRILSLTGLGLSLIFISWLYSRFGPGAPMRSGTPTY
jgi:hypothetical protein